MVLSNNNQHSALWILRVGLAVTFVWIGIMILQDPEGWTGYVTQSWVIRLLPVPLVTAMQGTGVLDIAIGLGLLLPVVSRWAALVGALHLLVVLLASGINTVTVRDIGLLGAAVAIFLFVSKRRNDVS